jgi:3-oxoacyl-[acyl-carrier protein] reductase
MPDKIEDYIRKGDFLPGKQISIGFMGSYTRSAAAELGPDAIMVNIVSPGPVRSRYIPSQGEEALISDIPLQRIGRPEDTANAVVFFASEQASWVTGQFLFVHGAIVCLY